MRRGAAACLLFMLLANVLMVSGDGGADGAGSGACGRGTSRATTLIYNVYELQNMSKDLIGYYELANDIDASDTKNWNKGKGFAPIACFSGCLDGKNHTIRELFINRSSSSDIGLFASISKGGSVRNIGLVDVNVTGYTGVGGLAGKNTGNVTTSFVTGNVTGMEYDVGGLVGSNFNQNINNTNIVNCTYALVNVKGKYSIGGLIGNNAATVLNSYAEGNVTGTDFNIGGLFGHNSGMVKNSHYNIDNMTINGGSYITYGGLFDEQYRDWLSNDRSLDISNYRTSLVPSGNYYNISDIQGLRDLFGFVDVPQYKFRLANDIDLSDDPGFYIPSLAARFDGADHVISNLSLDLPFVSAVGMFGYNDGGAIENIGVSGNIMNGYFVGGLVGANWGAVNSSHAAVNAMGKQEAGGLIGLNTYGTVDRSFATGNVSGKIAGGLMGFNERGTVNNSYATGTVNGSTAGGLLGGNLGIVDNSYATGKATGSGWAGGLAGGSIGNISNCFWDRETSGLDSSDGGTGKTTAEMKTKSTFTDAGWDFKKIWQMIENVTYPVFHDFGSLFANAGVDRTVDEHAPVTFNGSGSWGRSRITNYTWTFIDKAARTLYGVQHSYRFDSPGIFVVTLKVTDTAGGWDVDTMTVTVRDVTVPHADAGPDQKVDKGTPVTFNGSASRDNVGITNYTWTFLDRNYEVLFGIRPTYLFDRPGIFVVTLKVADAGGNWGTDSMTVTALELPAPCADAGPDMAIDEGTVLTFNGNGSRSDIEIVNYTWTFTDGGPVALYGVQPSHRFDEPGSFVVTLVVTDAAGNTGQDTMTVTVKAVAVKDIMPPLAVAGPDQTVDEGTLVIFDGSGCSDNIGIVSYTWTFTDGADILLYGARPAYQVNNPGIFVATLNVTDAAGNRGTDTMTVTVKDIRAPFPNAGPDRTVDERTMVLFNGSRSSDNVGIVNYTWTFDYGAKKIVLSGVSPRFFFNVPGVYSVKLDVSDAAGHRTDDTLVVTVNDITPPVAVAGQARRVRVGSIVVLDGSLSSDNCGIEEYFWNFTYDGNAQSLEGRSVTFRFDRPGAYEVVLMAIDGAGNHGEDSVVITVVALAKAVNGGQWSLPWIPVLVIAMVVVGLAGYTVRRIRKAQKGGPSASG